MGLANLKVCIIIYLIDAPIQFKCETLLIFQIFHGTTVIFILGGCTWACVAAGTSSTCRCPISETETVGRCYCDCGDGGRAGPGDYCYDNDDGQGVWSYAEPKTGNNSQVIMCFCVLCCT